MQYHLFSKNQPENLAFLERMRKLLDEYEARAMVGEMGESHHAIRMMGEYTTGKRLHKSYSFEMLGDHFTAAHFRGQIEEFFAGAPGGWPTWAFSNHDVPRHVTRWASTASARRRWPSSPAALLLSLEGSICIYQGEELGQTETELEFYELTDPQGIRFWPEHKGRDGCRTPMVWDAAEPNAGFSTGRPWLPIKAPQAARAVGGPGGGRGLGARVLPRDAGAPAGARGAAAGDPALPQDLRAGAGAPAAKARATRSPASSTSRPSRSRRGSPGSRSPRALRARRWACSAKR